MNYYFLSGVFYSVAELAEMGVVVSLPPTPFKKVDLYINKENLILSSVIIDFNNYIESSTAVYVGVKYIHKVIAELVHDMPIHHVHLKELFDSAFATIEIRQQRPLRDMELYRATQHLPDPVVSEADYHTALYVLEELKALADENRAAMNAALALEITEGMTLEEAQAIVMEVVNTKPWLPWDGYVAKCGGNKPCA